MPRRSLHLQPPGPSGAPRFVQIANAISEDILRGRLTPGDTLPGSRGLARTLGVGRDTVTAAFAELEAQGWLVSVERRGTVVADVPNTRATRHRGVAERPGFALDTPPMRAVTIVHPPEVMRLDLGLPDVRLVPGDLIARAYRRALRRHGKRVLGYAADPRGQVQLREALAGIVRDARGIAASADEVLVTRGSQMALSLIARAVIRPGDAVAVEELGYRPAWAVFEHAGAKLVGIPVDRGGIDVDALAQIVARRRLRAVYVTPHHQYPTTALLGAARRMQLLELVRAHRLVLLEDDSDHEFHYAGRPVLPIASADPHGVVLYLGTLSKVLAPGLRLGYVVASRPVIDRLTAERALFDRQGDLALELAIAELIDDGELARHVRKMQHVYHARRDALVHAIERHLGGTLAVRMAIGGMAVWADVDEGIDLEAWERAALAAGLAFGRGGSYALVPRRVQAMRLAFAAFTERELTQAATRLAATRPRR